jgi:hypothetical protein
MYIDAIAMDRLRSFEICRPFISASPFGGWLPEPLRNRFSARDPFERTPSRELGTPQARRVVNDFPLKSWWKA